MSRKEHGQRAKWALPDVAEPSGTRCFLVPVPDNVFYISAFRGALYEMCKAYAWGDDAEHTALLAAARSQEMWNGISEVDCGMPDLQFRACESGCGFEYSRDSINWTCVDLSGCITSLANDAINDAITNGIIERPGSQPGPEDAPAPDTCKTFHVRLNGRDSWHCPFPISSGDSVRVFNATGGWYDGELAPFGMWSCPGGTEYIGGICGDVVPADPSDPLQTANHMQLIGAYNGEYFDPFTLFVIPSGQMNQELFLCANDGDRTDNQGDIEFDVEICMGSLWTHVFDFTTSDGGFVQVPGQKGVWVSGQGWNGEFYDAYSNPECVIQKTGFTATVLTQAIVTVNRSAANGPNRLIRIQFHNGATLVAQVLDGSARTGNELTLTLNANELTDSLHLTLNNGTGGGTNRIVSLSVSGRGEDPF